MSSLIDIAGERYGNLTIKKYISSPSKWLAKCDCGEEIEITRRQLKKGRKSCGCLRSQASYQNILNKVKSANTNPKKYVYVAAFVGPCNRNLMKIGSTSNVYDRISQLSSEFDGDFDLMVFAETRLASDLENALHKIFFNDRVIVNRKDGTESREFFFIHPFDVIRYFEEVGADIFND